MNWNWPFGRPAPEAKTAVPLIALSQPAAASWGGRDAGALTRDGYLRNAIAYRCVRMIAEAAAAIPLKTAHPGAARLIRKPAPDMARAGFLEAVYSEFLLTGNAFVEAVRLPGESEISALFPVRSGAVRPLLDGRGWPVGWAVRTRQGERTIRRDADGWSPLLHLKLYHPQDEVMGLPPLAAARRALDLHNTSADWAKALIDNAAKPSGALVYGGGGRMPPDQFDRLKRELEESFTGAANAGRPMLLEGDLDWRQMSLTPAEMDFQAARASAAREIALALGVPPMLLGLPGDNTYANYREANLSFWRMTVLPLGARLAEAMSCWLDTPFGAEVEVSLDLDAVPALSAERDALWARLEAASFLTADEKRALAGITP